MIKTWTSPTYCISKLEAGLLILENTTQQSHKQPLLWWTCWGELLLADAWMLIREGNQQSRQKNSTPWYVLGLTDQKLEWFYAIDLDRTDSQNTQKETWNSFTRMKVSTIQVQRRDLSHWLGHGNGGPGILTKNWPRGIPVIQCVGLEKGCNQLSFLATSARVLGISAIQEDIMNNRTSNI